MAEWRIGRGWSEAELGMRLQRLRSTRRNFDDPDEKLSLAHGWHEYYSEALVAREAPGPPVEGGSFARGRVAVANYAFSDPRIVIGHFEPDVPLLGRPMLLEMRAMRVLHYLSGVIVSKVRSEEEEDRTVFGFRYDTLEGHIERGIEWFLLTKDRATGEIRFRIEAAWLPGDFPNWWSRLGFSLLGPRYQRQWHHRAHHLLRSLMANPEMEAGPPRDGRLVHIDEEIVFKRLRAPRP